MYLKGKGVEKNYKKSYDYFQKAAAKNNPDGLYYLGFMIDNGFIIG